MPVAINWNQYVTGPNDYPVHKKITEPYSPVILMSNYLTSIVRLKNALATDVANDRRRHQAIYKAKAQP